MCDDHGSAPVADTGGITRRRFMHGAGLLAATVVLPGRPRQQGSAATIQRLAMRSPARDVGFDGKPAYSMAMHVHSSFSEQNGSMDAQLYQAASNAVDVLWWTDHDARMSSRNYRKTVHFTSLTAESGATGESGPWKWVKQTHGPVGALSTGGIVANPCSPLDPVVGGAMAVTAKSRTTVAASYGFFANCHPAGDNYKDNLTGQSLSLEVMPTTGWSRGYLELLATSSFHPATAGRPAGVYALSYRFVPPGVPAGRVATGVLGVVTIPVQPGQWSSITVRPDDDIAALWPDLDTRDFGLSGINVNAVSTGDTVTGYVDYLRFDRQLAGSAQFDMQKDMELLLAPKYPSVTQQQGLEVSWLLPHINWFGGQVVLPDYGTTAAKNYSAFIQNTTIPQIHRAGGLASYNHPYGYAEGTLLPIAQQQAMLAQVAAALLATRAMGVDLIEIGYNVRQGVGLAGHVALWDVMSRNAVFLTGNGTNDDHYGQDWTGIVNNFFTSTWAASTAEADLLASLAAGRAWCAPLASYRGSMDLLVDGACPMGSVSVSGVGSRQLSVSATDVPAGGSVQVVQGPVDYAGTQALSAGTVVVASVAAADLAGDQVGVALDTTASSYVRTQVVDASGAVIGLSNPVWLLRDQPPHGIPAPRAV